MSELSQSNHLRKLPTIIQGGMGAAVSNWRLARAVAQSGEMGVVSGTALDSVLIRRLQDGDPGGHMRRGLAAFPCPLVAQSILERWFIPCGREVDQPYKLKPLPVIDMGRGEVELLIVASFVEIYLAKEGHGGRVGLNLLEKIQLPTLPSLFGAMLAGVDSVLMGGGIPIAIPGILDAFAELRAAELQIHVQGAERDAVHTMQFDPMDFLPADAKPLKRPLFFPVISSDVLAKSLVRKCGAGVNGFIVEHHSAGGHNAPPRRGDCYGPRDGCDFLKMAALGLPFWLAGGRASPEGLETAKALGAIGVQVGTAFACSDESGIDPMIKAEVIEAYLKGELEVVTDFKASPTGYPFKRVDLKANERPEPCRVCDLGYLRHVYQKEDGKIGYRCPAAPEKAFLSKGGTLEEAEGKRCLCNGLLAVIGMPQVAKDGTAVPPLLTWGEDMSFLDSVLAGGKQSYSAADFIFYLRGNEAAEESSENVVPFSKAAAS